MKKQSNPMPPKGLKRPPPPPAPPAPPPGRTFKCTIFSGEIETEESKQLTRDWKNYIRGYSDGIGSNKDCIKE